MGKVLNCIGRSIKAYSMEIFIKWLTILQMIKCTYGWASCAIQANKLWYKEQLPNKETMQTKTNMIIIKNFCNILTLIMYF